jgi:hypothetical protein
VVIPVATTRRPSDVLLPALGVRLMLWMSVTRFWLPELFTAAAKLGWHFDEHYFYLREDAARITYLRYGQLPAWNPYACGGIPGLGNPQDASLSPDFILRLVFGTNAGRHIATVLFVVLGMEGTYRLARRYDAAVPGAALAAVAFATSARFAGLVEDGWLHMFAFELMPWAALGLEIGTQRRTGWLLGGFILGWMVMCAGTYVVPYTGLLLGSMVALRTAEIAWRSRARTGRVDGRATAAPAICLARMIGVSALLTAVRVLPLLAIIRAHPRYFYTPESSWPGDVLGGLALRATDERWTRLLWTPLGGFNYIGTVVFGLAVLGVVTVDRRAIGLAILAVLFGSLACGVHGPLSPWSIVHRLPLFTQLRAPYRFIVVAGLLVSLVAARGLTRIEEGFELAAVHWRRRRPGPPGHPLTQKLILGSLGAAVAVAVAILAARQTIVDHRLLVGAVFDADAPLRTVDDFRQAKGNRWDAHVYPAANRGVLTCFEETEFPESPLLRGDIPSEEYADPTSDAKVTRTLWTPNRIVLHVDAPRSFDLMVNQNFHGAWRASRGEVFSKEKLLAVHAPAGQYDLVLTFRDWSVVVGGFVSVAGLLLVTVLLWPVVRSWLRAVRRALR